MHQRHAVTALGFIHKVGGDKNGHFVLTRQIDHQLPEHIPGHRVNTGGRFIEDQHFRAMDHRHRQRQPLANAERERLGQRILNLRQHKTFAHLLNALGDFRFRDVKQPGVELKVLSNRQLAVQRKRLRHVAHPAAGVDIFRVNRLTKQPGLTFTGRQQPGQHLHGGRFTAAVGTEEAKNLPRGMRKLT